MHQRIRASHDHQRMAAHERLGVREPKLLAAIRVMEENLEEPLSLGEIARRANLSVRQLERLFKQRLVCPPSRYYLELRLHHARLLLMRGASSILAIALAAGFASASHFSRRYREHFGHSPREERGFRLLLPLLRSVTEPWGKRRRSTSVHVSLAPGGETDTSRHVRDHAAMEALFFPGTMTVPGGSRAGMDHENCPFAGGLGDDGQMVIRRGRHKGSNCGLRIPLRIAHWSKA